MARSAIVALPVLSIVACGGEPSDAGARAPQTEQAQSDIARVHRAKCGKCHERVEPGERSRDELDDALSRHRTRVPLSEDQWRAMIDYLASVPNR